MYPFLFVKISIVNIHTHTHTHTHTHCGISLFLFLFLDILDGAQGLARQALHHLSHTSSPPHSCLKTDRILTTDLPPVLFFHLSLVLEVLDPGRSSLQISWCSTQKPCVPQRGQMKKIHF
jgi:hypothetical protein